MSFKQPGVPMMDTSKKHGTNANFGKSGMNDKNGKPVKAGAPGFFGNLMKGKGALGLLNPVGGPATPPPVAGAVEEPVVDPNAGVSAAGAPPVA